MKILDSGKRTQFYDADGNEMGVRDVQEGKGRCDLLPLDVVAVCLCDPVISHIAGFQESGDPNCLINALTTYRSRSHFPNMATLILEVAIHFEDGAKKYGERNWEKGIPVQRYIDSAIRHYLKWLRGDDDEPHDRAFCWNLMCAIWTCKHKPELNEYKTGCKTHE